VGATVAVLLLPAITLAHPLGNFTINHYAGLRVETDRVLLDVVIDQAEVPAFQARLAFDADDDGSVSDEEAEVGRIVACTDLAADLRLTADGAALELRPVTAGLSFPTGTSGLSTLRLVCGFEAALPAALSTETPTRIAFTDSSHEDRLGWREIVVVGSGAIVTVVDGGARPASVSQRLAVYPEELVAQPLMDESVTVDAVAGGPILAAVEVLDAAVVAAVPGGIEGDLPSIFQAADVTPFVLLLSLATAGFLGAGHALTPGHGKTLMAAYLVGTRGTPLHALGLGLSVSVSHTVGILVLAAIVMGAADVLPPDLVVRGAPVVAAISILGIGAWMLVGEVRRRRSVAASERAHAEAHAHGHEHEHHHGNEEADRHVAGERGHLTGEHSHGGVTHSHLPPAGTSITWRSLFVLGLAGGLIPSTSALLILLGSIAAGRPAFGFVLVVAFGLGMAAVMAGIGLLVVAARDRADRLPAGGALGRVREFVPLTAAVLVFGFGLYLTTQALTGTPTL
jgi:nickel/cobalt exporter